MGARRGRAHIRARGEERTQEMSDFVMKGIDVRGEGKIMTILDCLDG